MTDASQADILRRLLAKKAVHLRELADAMRLTQNSGDVLMLARELRKVAREVSALARQLRPLKS